MGIGPAANGQEARDAYRRNHQATWRRVRQYQVDGPQRAAYKRLCSILDRADNDALKTAYAAKIPFVSSLSLNRMLERGII
jgi:hypothetical protein